MINSKHIATIQSLKSVFKWVLSTVLKLMASIGLSKLA